MDNLFTVYEGTHLIGFVCKKLILFKPYYNIDFNGWHIEGSWTEWDYSIMDASGNVIAGKMFQTIKENL